MVVDLRGHLEQFHASAAQPTGDDHLFLILDKQTQLFPWEALPSIENRSISRVPSLRFIYDRLDLAIRRQSQPDHLTINASKAYYMLNPSGDLTATQHNFSDWLKKKPWQGTIGKPALELEVKDALQSKDLFLYVWLQAHLNRRSLVLSAISDMEVQSSIFGLRPFASSDNALQPFFLVVLPALYANLATLIHQGHLGII